MATSYEESCKYDLEQGHSEDTCSTDVEKPADETGIQHAPEGTASVGKSLCMLLKAFVGTGVIFLPNSFKNGGLALSIVLMVILALICLVAFQLLVVAQRSVGGSYGDVARKLYGSWCRYIVLFFLAISQMGFVASYLIFISQNIGLVAQKLSDCNAPFDSKYWIWIACLIIIPFCWVRKIARLSYNAIIADIFILFGLICVLYYSADKIHWNGGAGPNIVAVNTQDFGLMIGTAVFSFEGIGMIVPVIEGMKNPAKFPMVLNLGMLIVTGIFILIGTIGYVAYGDQIQANIVASFAPDALSTTVQLLYAIAMILTSPFMLYPALTIIERGIFGSKRSGQVSLVWKWSKNFVRTLIPLICASVSFGVGSENLDKFVSLVGIVACMPLCFIFPGMFHYKVTKNTYLRIVDVLLILFGCGIMIYTLYVNVNSWVHPTPSSSSELCMPIQSTL